MTMRVAVLYGGISAEREVSLSSGKQVIAALREAGFDVQPIEVGADLGAVIAALDPKPDVVFNALHGRFGEDGTIQGVLDWLDIPYTHSGMRASASRWTRKPRARCSSQPACRSRAAAWSNRRSSKRPTRSRGPTSSSRSNEGSSVGVEIIREGDNRRAEVARNWRYNGAALVEEYIPGRELTVGVMGERALAVTEIVASHGFYDYESKYADGGSRHEVPARVHPETYARAMDIAVAAHRALGCRGASRADFRYDDTAGDAGPARAARSEHAARADADLAAARTGRASRHELPRALHVDGGERRMSRVTRSPRNSVQDRPGRLKLMLRRQRWLLRRAALAGGVLLARAGRSRPSSGTDRPARPSHRRARSSARRPRSRACASQDIVIRDARIRRSRCCARRSA